MAGMSGSEQMSDNPAMTDRPGDDGVCALGYLLESERMRQFARHPARSATALPSAGSNGLPCWSSCRSPGWSWWSSAPSRSGPPTLPRSGDPFVVFPRHGSIRWHEDISFLAIGAIGSKRAQ
jgi:hypothetical protein